MKKFYLMLLVMVLGVTNIMAQKKLFIPAEWKVTRSDTLLYAENDPDNKYTWSKSRSKESDNFILYWDKYYTTDPGKLSSSNYYYVNTDDLLKKAEAFYAMNVGKLAFCDEAVSKVKNYKMMILMNHTTTWTCYGGGYDFTIGALWLNPATCKPVGHSVAHEVGHSFQYMCYSDMGGHSGFHDAIGNGSTFWEQTAQWQANQSYPELKWDQSWFIFKNTHNTAMTHEWHRYQSYWWHYYLAEKYGIDIIGKIWRHQMSKAADANEVFMDLMGYDVNTLFKEYFDYAMKMATLDLDVARSEAKNYIGTYKYDYISLTPNKHQVAYSSCPQSTGFNVIPLNVPAAGTKVSTEFTSLKTIASLAEGDPVSYFDGDKYVTLSGRTTYNVNTNYGKRGFRLGYVALMKDGTRQYFSEDEVYCTGGTSAKSCTVGFTVPENVDRLFMVVCPAPTSYFQHKWDENIANDDQWPYTVEFTGTNILGAPNIPTVIDESLPITDAKVNIDVYFAKSSTTYPATTVKIDGDAAPVLATAFQMPVSEVAGKMTSWSSSGPANGKIIFCGVNSTGALYNGGSTANGYGHWFNSAGNVSAYSSGYTYSEFDPATMTFTLGQYPGKLTDGKTYTIRQAFRYKRGTETAQVTFVFNIHVTSTQTGYNITSVEQDEIIDRFLHGDPEPEPIVIEKASISSENVDLAVDETVKLSFSFSGDVAASTPLSVSAVFYDKANNTIPVTATGTVGDGVNIDLSGLQPGTAYSLQVLSVEAGSPGAYVYQATAAEGTSLYTFNITTADAPQPTPVEIGTPTLSVVDQCLNVTFVGNNFAETCPQIDFNNFSQIVIASAATIECDGVEVENFYSPDLTDVTPAGGPIRISMPLEHGGEYKVTIKAGDLMIVKYTDDDFFGSTVYTNAEDIVLTLTVKDTETSVDGIAIESSSAAYTISGVRTNTLVPGNVYIINGKKVRK